MLFPLVGGFIILTAVMVMIGWVFNISALTAVFPGFPAMKFNAAFAFAFSGAATMLVFYVDKKPVPYFYFAFSAIVFVIGFLTLIQIIFNFNIGIDRLFFTDQSLSDEMTPYPGRMVGATALSFCILGAAFMGIRSPVNKVRRLAQYGLHVVSLLAAIAMMGYSFQLTSLYKIAHFTSEALHTALAFIVLSVTLTFYNPSMGIQGLFTGKGVGNKMARKLFPSVAVTGIILGFVRMRLFRYHFVSFEFGVAISVTILLLITLLWIWIVAVQLNKLEADKKETDAANFNLNLDIAAAKKAEHEIAEINKRNLLFVQQAPSAIAMFDTEMHYIAASEQWIRDYKLQGKEIIGHSHYEVFPEIGEDWKTIHRDCLKGAVNKCDESYFVRADGSAQWITWDVRPWYSAENKIGGLLMYTADISHLKRNEAIIKETSESLADAQHIAHVGSWDWNLVTNEMKRSDEQCRILGVEPESGPSPGIHFYNVLHPDDKQKVMQLVKEALAGIKPFETEFRIVRSDGEVRDIEARGKVLRDNEGKPVRMIGTLADITGRKKLERDLMISEKEFRSSFEDSAVGMTFMLLDFKWLRINEAFCKMLGYTKSELRQMTFQDVTYPDDLGGNMLHLKQLRNKEIEKYQVEKRYLHKNGSIVWALLTVSMVFDDKEAPLYYISHITDITERKRIEGELKKVNSELNSLFNTETHASIVSTDLNGIITHFSKGAEILLGYKAEELVGRCSPVVFHDPLEVEARRKELSALLQREVGDFDVFVAFARNRDFESREWTYVCKDGGRLPVQLVISAIKDESGNIKGFLGIATDTTERREAEETRKNYAVLQSRNKEMEEFAYIASHDLQEPLRTVTSFAKLLQSEYGDRLKGDAELYLQFISASTSRMSELIKGLLEYSRIGMQKTVEPVDCNVVVKEVIEDIGLAVKESQAVIMVDDLPVISAFPTEMKQLFQNLLGNAIKFKKTNEAPLIHISARVLPGYWQFEVSDNGIGIDRRHFDKIFILFQRLHRRDDYKGTGIGLSYCKKIVELHHGNIWVESVPGRGSRFFFTISNHNV